MNSEFLPAARHEEEKKPNPGTTNEKEGFRMSATLLCGISVEVVQPGTSQVLEFTITPAEGQKIEDTAWIKDGKLRINATIPAILGMREFFTMMFQGRPKKKSFFQRLRENL